MANSDSLETVNNYLLEGGIKDKIFKRSFIGNQLQLYEITGLEPSHQGVMANIKYHYNDKPSKELSFGLHGSKVGLSSLLFDREASQEELDKISEKAEARTR